MYDALGYSDTVPDNLNAYIYIYLYNFILKSVAIPKGGLLLLLQLNGKMAQLVQLLHHSFSDLGLILTSGVISVTPWISPKCSSVLSLGGLCSLI